jgi:uncharacterized protein YbjT (DUF2867 family)
VRVSCLGPHCRTHTLHLRGPPYASRLHPSGHSRVGRARFVSVPTSGAPRRPLLGASPRRRRPIDARDIGEVAAKVLGETGHEDKVYTLTGPTSISLYDVATVPS